jgi:hypothetical protein
MSEISFSIQKEFLLMHNVSRPESSRSLNKRLHGFYSTCCNSWINIIDRTESQLFLTCVNSINLCRKLFSNIWNQFDYSKKFFFRNNGFEPQM